MSAITVSPYSCIPVGVLFYQGRNSYPAAPAFDPNQNARQFQVTNPALIDANGNYSYLYPGFDSTGNPAMLSNSIPGARAMSPVNLPGVPTVPSYASWLASRPTVTATYTLVGQSPNPLPQEALYTPAEAQALASEIASQLGVIAIPRPLTAAEGNSQLTYSYPNLANDPRQVWDIVIGGMPFAMGVEDFITPNDGLFQSRNKGGMGWPGTWNWNNRAAGGPPQFVDTQFTSYGTTPNTITDPVPCVLPAGATLTASLGGVIEILLAGPLPNGGGGTVDLTPVLTLLNRIITGLQKAGFNV